MKLLALDTSSDACSVALACDGDVKVDHRVAPQKHAQLLLPMIEQIVVDAGIKLTDLDGVAFGCGPGSFTGVRIAAATTQGIAFGADIGVIAVSSLRALAQGVCRTHSATHVLASFDARMGEVYWGAYELGDDGVAIPMQDDRVCAPQQVSIPADVSEREWCLVGSGADAYQDVLHTAIGKKVLVNYIGDRWPNAQDVLSVAQLAANAGRFQTAADALPVYLRERVALTEQQRAAGEQL